MTEIAANEEESDLNALTARIAQKTVNAVKIENAAKLKKLTLLLNEQKKKNVAPPANVVAMMMMSANEEKDVDANVVNEIVSANEENENENEANAAKVSELLFLYLFLSNMFDDILQWLSGNISLIFNFFSLMSLEEGLRYFQNVS